MTRVLITGADGFIASALRKKLLSRGYDVWGIARSEDNKNQILGADLLNLDAILRIHARIPKFNTLIHTAALAHGQSLPKGETVISTNLSITKNVIKTFNDVDNCIFFSSVAVYGEDKRYNLISPNDETRPATNYGKSKLMCEETILKSRFKHLTVIRLTPVYDRNHMKDIRKRVFFPGSKKIKMRIVPAPKYSFTHINTVINEVLSVLEKRDKLRICNVYDEKPYCQSQISDWFEGYEVLIPLIITKPFYWLTFILFPGKFGYKVRCNYWKLFCNNLYRN